MNQNDYVEYETLMIELTDGSMQEFAIMDEFVVDEKHYMAVSLVKDDEIQEGIYLYRSIKTGNEYEAVRIEDEAEFDRVISFYEQM